MTRPNMGKSFIVSTEDLENTSGGGGGVTMEQVNAAIQAALQGYVKGNEVWGKQDSYNRTEIDAKLADKANKGDVYAKADVYTKAEADTKLDTKANKADVYTKAEADGKFQAKT